jgi:hypothetical protein
LDNLPAIRSTETRPAMVDRQTDFEITKLWRDRDVDRKPINIARALTDDERAACERRKRDLQLGTAPYAPSEGDRVVAAISRMFGGNRTMARIDDESAVAVAAGLLHILKPFPLWAIEAGCDALHEGEAVLNGKTLSPNYAPHDAEVRLVIKEIVKPYRDALDNVTALLAAPVRDARSA